MVADDQKHTQDAQQFQVALSRCFGRHRSLPFWLVFFQQHNGIGQTVFMRQADMDRQTALRSPGCGASGKFKVRRPVFRPQQGQLRQGKAAQAGTGRF